MSPTLLFLSAILAVASRGFAVPFQAGAVTTAGQKSSLYRQQGPVPFGAHLDQPQTGRYHLAGFENTELQPSPADSPSGPLGPERYLPASYIVSHDHASTEGQGEEMLQHTSAPETPYNPYSYGFAPGDEISSLLAGYEKTDPIIIAFFVAFIFLVVVIELRYHRLISLEAMRSKLLCVVDVFGPVRLDGDERQLRACKGEVMTERAGESE